MLDLKTFLKGFHLLKDIFEFDNSKVYLDAVYNSLKNKVSNEMFADRCVELATTIKKEEWNIAYGFKGRPALKDWIDAFIPEPVIKRRIIVNKEGDKTEEVYQDYPDWYLDIIKSHKELQFETTKQIGFVESLEHIKKSIINQSN